MEPALKPAFDFDWYGDSAGVFQNPRNLLPAPAERELSRGTLLFATSGSSGRPKWVAHTRASLLASAVSVNRHLQATAADVWLCALPKFHVSGCGIHARASLSGSPVVTTSGPWSPPQFLALASTAQVTLSSLVPTQVHDLVEMQARPPSSLRAVLIGGGVLDPALYFAARTLGWPLLPCYGMTEAATQIATASLDSLQEMKWPPLQVLDHWETRVTDASELEIRGPALFHGYYVQSDDGGWEWQNPFHQDWFRCADKVRLLPDGQLQWLGRSDRVTKVLGELVDLDQIERELSQRAHRPIVVLALPDARRGMNLHAVSEGEGPAADWEMALAEYHASCAPFARISTVHQVKQFPRSDLGKPLRGKLLEMLPGF